MNLKYCDWCEENTNNLRDSSLTKITLRDEDLSDVPFEVCSECTRLIKANLYNQLIIRMATRV
jgi:hypothetical protein